MKFMKRANIYQAFNYNVTFDPNKIEARSYRGWVFVAKIEGLIVFNNYRYSNATSRHQSKVRSLLKELNIKIDLELPLPRGIKSSCLQDLIVEAEECLCDEIGREELKRQDRNAKAKQRRFKKKLEHYLENVVHFRDYEIKSRSQFGTYNKVAVHQVVEDIESDVSNALHNFHRDGFSNIVFYVGV